MVSSFLTIKSTLAYDPTRGWIQQANNCSPVPGKVNENLYNIYLGVGQTVPQSILNQFPNATASILEDWKANMYGLILDQFRSFIIPGSLGYKTGYYAGQDLYFEVWLTEILNGGTVTTSNSVVNLIYSIYINCQVDSSYPSSTLTHSAPSATSDSSGPPPPNFTSIIIGVFAALVIFAVVGYIVYNGRKNNLSTDKIINKTRDKENQTIQSLKDSLDTQPIQKQKAPPKKAPPNRRRR